MCIASYRIVCVVTLVFVACSHTNSKDCSDNVKEYLALSWHELNITAHLYCDSLSWHSLYSNFVVDVPLVRLAWPDSICLLTYQMPLASRSYYCSSLCAHGFLTVSNLFRCCLELQFSWQQHFFWQDFRGVRLQKSLRPWTCAKNGLFFL